MPKYSIFFPVSIDELSLLHINVALLPYPASLMFSALLNLSISRQTCYYFSFLKENPFSIPLTPLNTTHFFPSFYKKTQRVSILLCSISLLESTLTALVKVTSDLDLLNPMINSQSSLYPHPSQGLAQLVTPSSLTLSSLGFTSLFPGFPSPFLAAPSVYFAGSCSFF